MKYIFAIFMLVLFINCNGTKDEDKKGLSLKELNDTIKTNVKHNKKTDLDNVTVDCIETVFDIIKSSKEYIDLTNGLQQKIENNGGTGFGFIVHVSPNPKLDNALEKGDFYEISIHENYSDRMNNIAFFRFDRHQKNLYKMDIVSAEYIEIDFNKDLIKTFNSACFK